MATKAKRKLSDISFEQDGAHIAVVSKEQGHGANGHHYSLVMKANNFSDEFIEKASKVKVTLDIEDFLVKFYGLWYSDAEVLARALGFDTKETDHKEKMESGEMEHEEYSHKDYITSQVEAIEIFKSLSEADSIPEVLSKLSEEEYLSVLKSQSKLEKAFKKVEQLKKKSGPAVSADGPETSTNASVEKNVGPTGSENVEKEEIEKMTDKTNVEMVEKSVVVDLQKALDAQKVQLEKALETVAQFEADKKAAIQKARKQEVLTAVKDEAKVEVLFKAIAEADDETFAAVVKTLADMQVAVEKSALFTEQGTSKEEPAAEKTSGVARIIKARLVK